MDNLKRELVLTNNIFDNHKSRKLEEIYAHVQKE